MCAASRDDPAIAAAALTGSAARGAEDRWSDIDRFFGAADGWPGYAGDRG
jgi:predicted nucleotidyltransferase